MAAEPRVSSWFEYAEGKLAEALEEAGASGQLRAGVDPSDRALTVMAVVQGGYLLARAHRDSAVMHRALAGAMALIEFAALPS